MIVIQILLILALVVIMTHFLASHNSSRTKAWKKVIFILFIATAVVMIVRPNAMNDLAHRLGVGRGADLLLYALVVAFIFMQLNGYIKTKEDQQRTATLVRKVAILEALLAYAPGPNKE